jgi:hypothetical protein
MELDKLLRDEPSLRGGEFGLWLRILCLSFFEIKKGRFSDRAAKEFLLDPGNIFFDFVAEEMGYEPDGLRERILKALAKR